MNTLSDKAIEKLKQTVERVAHLHNQQQAPSPLPATSHVRFFSINGAWTAADTCYTAKALPIYWGEQGLAQGEEIDIYSLPKTFGTADEEAPDLATGSIVQCYFMGRWCFTPDRGGSDIQLTFQYDDETHELQFSVDDGENWSEVCTFAQFDPITALGVSGMTLTKTTTPIYVIQTGTAGTPAVWHTGEAC